MNQGDPTQLDDRYIVVTTTTETLRDAQDLARALVARRLAGCVQIVGPIQSVYQWNDELTQSSEYRCEIKTHASKWNAIEHLFDDIHPYEVPEMIATPLLGLSPGYQEWLQAQLFGAE
jgi:periplasmic divalent cation tolerance protein